VFSVLLVDRQSRRSTGRRKARWYWREANCQLHGKWLNSDCSARAAQASMTGADRGCGSPRRCDFWPAQAAKSLSGQWAVV
jgi:hypothetical protein